MEVILLERVGKLGQMGNVVKVRDGYARNYLLPQGKALRANKANRERFERTREDLEKVNFERREQAEAEAAKLENTSWTLIRQASESLQLYGSVSARDIAEAIAESGVAVRRQQVMLGQTIKTLGVHPVKIALHPEVTVEVKIHVARSTEEAGLLGARGAEGSQAAAAQSAVAAIKAPAPKGEEERAPEAQEKPEEPRPAKDEAGEPKASA